MSVIAEFSIPAEQFALGHLLEVREGVRIRLESMIPTGESMIPYFWVSSPDIEEVERTLQDSPVVEEVKIVDRVEDEALFRVEWSDDINGIIEAIIESETVIMKGNGHGDYWTFEFRFPEYEDLSNFYRTVVDNGVSVDLESIHNPIESSGSDTTQLSSEQREALLAAYQQGYFAVPREVTLVELADQLGISDSAVSQRIRRGLSKLLADGLLTE